MFKENLKQYRKERGLNQFDLAIELGVSQPTIAGWESGIRRPDIDMLVCIADFFGVTTDELLGIKKDNTDEELWQLREQVRRDPERRELFHKARYAGIDEVRQAVAILDALKKTKGGD